MAPPVRNGTRNGNPVIRSYMDLVRLTDDKDTLIEIARQILIDHRLPFAGRQTPSHPFHVVMDKLEAMRR